VTLNKVIAGALYIVICGWNAVKHAHSFIHSFIHLLTTWTTEGDRACVCSKWSVLATRPWPVTQMSC